MATPLAALALWLGTMGREVVTERPLPPGPPPGRILVLSDGLGGWETGLALASSRCEGPEVRVLSREGARSRWGLSRLDWVAALEPDLVVVSFAAGDATASGDGVGRALDALRPSRSGAMHDALLDELRARLPEARVLLVAAPPAERRWGLRPRLRAHLALYAPLARRHGAGLLGLGRGEAGTARLARLVGAECGAAGRARDA